MTIASSSSGFAPWSDRLRRSAIVLIAAALVLAGVTMFGGLTVVQAAAVFLVITGAALVPWHLQHTAPVADDLVGARPAEMPVVQAVVGGMPDAAVLLDRAGRVLHFNQAASQLAPAPRRHEPARAVSPTTVDRLAARVPIRPVGVNLPARPVPAAPCRAGTPG